MFIKQIVQKDVIFAKYKKGLRNKTKIYKHVMFTNQNTKQKVYKTKQMFINTLCLQNKIQNKSLQARYLQNKTNVYNTNVYKTKVYKHVMFTK